MEKIATRYIVLCFVLIPAACFANLIAYDINGYNKEAGMTAISKIPRSIDDWIGKDFPLDPFVYNILETRAIIHRNYTRNDRSVFLSVVYYPGTKVDFHTPEGCLAGKGVQIEKSTAQISFESKGKKINISSNQLIRENNGNKELIYYFFKTGDFLGENYFALRFHLVLNKLTAQKSGSLIRISTPVRGNDFKQASTILTAFTRELYPYLVRFL